MKMENNWRKSQRVYFKQSRFNRRKILLSALVTLLTLPLFFKGILFLKEKGIQFPFSKVQAPDEINPDLGPVILAALEIPQMEDVQIIPIGDNTLSIDSDLQKQIQTIFKKYNPAFATAVVLDAEDSSVLALVNHQGEKNFPEKEFWPLSGRFPAASIYKLVTAAAAIEDPEFSLNTRLQTTGNPYRLYPKKIKDKRWMRGGRKVTLLEAFSNSYNVPFGDLTLRYLDKDILQEMSYKFGFDRSIPFNLNITKSHTVLPDNKFKLAETSAGLGENTLSPMHGALMAAAIVNDGIVYPPSILSHPSREKGSHPFIHLRPSTAKEIEKMMQRTISHGTARRTFRGWNRHPVLKGSLLGGKTGSLMCKEFKGRCDWFIGFGQKGLKKIAVSILMVNRHIWHIKPPIVARRIWEKTLQPSQVMAVNP